VLNQVVSGPLSEVSCLNAPGRLTLLPTNRAELVILDDHHDVVERVGGSVG
jgi:hypothetical protein